MSSLDTFAFEGLTLPYLPQKSGEHIGERRIEVPLAREWLKRQEEARVMEVGAVLPYYQQVHHSVVDPYDPNLQVTCYKDAEEVDFTARAVLSISTIEHIGTKEYSEKPDIFKARRVLRKIVEEASAFLISIPIGFHLCLDAMLQDSGGPMRFMRQVERVGRSPASPFRAGNLWEPCAPDWTAQYGAPLPYANVVVFISNSFDWAKAGVL